MAEKAALLAAVQKREAKARANKCALHPDQIKYLYCSDCEEAVCAVCVHGRHAAHGKVEIAEAAAEARKRFESELQLIAAAASSADGHGAAGGLGTLTDADALRAKICKMQTGQTAPSGGRGSDQRGHTTAAVAKSTAAAV